MPVPEANSEILAPNEPLPHDCSLSLGFFLKRIKAYLLAREQIGFDNRPLYSLSLYPRLLDWIA